MAQWSMGSRFSYFLIDHSDHGLKLRSWLLNCVDHFFSGSVFFSTFYRWKISIFRCQKKNLLSLNGAAKRILQTSKKYQTNSIRRRFSIDLRIQSRFTFHFPFKSAFHVLSLACRFFFLVTQISSLPDSTLGTYSLPASILCNPFRNSNMFPNEADRQSLE